MITLVLYTVFSSGSQVIFVTGLKISDIYLLHLGARHIHHGAGARGGALGARASPILKKKLKKLKKDSVSFHNFIILITFQILFPNC